jgi:sulfatase modifying factor 1
MKLFKTPIKSLLACTLVVFMVSSCPLLKKGSSIDSKTGAEYATEGDMLGYQPYNEQELPAPPGMVFIQGGRTVLGSFEQDLYGARDNVERTVTVNSFFMDETEVTNANWKLYVHHQFHPMDLPLPSGVEVLDPNDEENQDANNPGPNPNLVRTILPGQTGINNQTKEEIEPRDDVWESDFAFNSVYAKNYYSNPGFNNYPVVGVTWRQVEDFCKWRTDFVNMSIIMEMDIESLPLNFREKFFVINAETGDYELGDGTGGGGQPSTRLDDSGDLAGSDRSVEASEQVITLQTFFDWQNQIVEYLDDAAVETEFIEQGIYFPDFRLPNEAEWEYAAKATIGTVYLDENEEYGRIYPWDGRSVRNPYGKSRGEFLANFKRGRGDYGGIAGGVNNDGSVLPEAVGNHEANDFNLFNMAGNVSEWVYDTYRPLAYQEVEDMNPVRKSLGADDTSDPQSNYDWKDQKMDKNAKLKDDGASYRSLINDRSKVYKGGSWKDVAYWMSPGTRRYLDMDEASNTLGFRCAMISIGTSQLN